MGECVHFLPSSDKPQSSSTGLRLALILLYPASSQPAGRPRNSSEVAGNKQNLALWSSLVAIGLKTIWKI